MPDVNSGNVKTAPERSPLRDVTARTHRLETVRPMPFLVNPGFHNDSFLTTYGEVMLSDGGEDRATSGFVSYALEHYSPAHGPHFLFWNGGPLSPATLWHNMESGPFVISRRPDGHIDEPPRLVVNSASPIRIGPMALFDPSGTGTGGPLPGQAHDHYYGVHRDVAAAKAKTKWYKETFAPNDEPLIFVGSSYAADRIIGACLELAKEGINIAGLIFVSGSYDQEALRYEKDGNPNPFANALPAMALSAQHHQKLPTREQRMRFDALYHEARGFAQGRYKDVLSGLGGLTTGRKNIIDDLVAYTGMPPEFIEEQNFRIDPLTFRRKLLESDGKVLSAIDGRLAFPNTDTTIEPAVDNWTPLYRAAMETLPAVYPYINSDYRGNVSALSEWDFSGLWSDKSAYEALGELLDMRPDLYMIHVAGLYDLICNTTATESFWRKMHHLTGVDVQYHQIATRSVINYRSTPGVDVAILPAGHQTGASDAARPYLATAFSAMARYVYGDQGW
jgi:carboxypeptidase C (cathepsin A)